MVTMRELAVLVLIWRATENLLLPTPLMRVTYESPSLVRGKELRPRAPYRLPLRYYTILASCVSAEIASSVEGNRTDWECFCDRRLNWISKPLPSKVIEK